MNYLMGLKVWQSPRGKRVVTHWASLLKWIWSISEYNLMTRGSRKRTPIGGPFIRERRGADLTNKSQSTTHVDPKAGTGGSQLYWLLIFNACDWSNLTMWPWPLPGAWEKSGTCLQCVWQRFIRSVGTQMVFQLDPWFLLGGIAHHKHWPQNMCYTHSWPQQKDYKIFVVVVVVYVYLYGKRIQNKFFF